VNTPARHDRRRPGGPADARERQTPRRDFEIHRRRFADDLSGENDGNIGAANRPDFTVIGPDVNLVTRIEAAAKSLNLSLVLSDDFRRRGSGLSTCRSAVGRAKAR
jgi:hypothetical protein